MACATTAYRKRVIGAAGMASERVATDLTMFPGSSPPERRRLEAAGIQRCEG
jgi:hypothetical protein